jgi:nitronate monooxygenase
MALPDAVASRLRLPLMLRVSVPALVAAACSQGIIGAFPTINARSGEELDDWLTRIAAAFSDSPGPVAPMCQSLIMRRRPEALDEDVAVLSRHRVPMVIASVGSPAPVIARLHDVD